MAGPRAWRSICRNPPLVGEDELAGAAPGALTNENRMPSHTPAVSRVLNTASAPPLAPAELVAKYTNADMQQAIKLALELFVQDQQQAQSQIASPTLEPQEKPLKARFTDLYYGNFHMDCYWFCQQCEDHFETAGAKESNRILFAALFLNRSVIQQWLQHKRRHNKAMPMTWPEFKDFFWKNLETPGLL